MASVPRSIAPATSSPQTAAASVPRSNGTAHTARKHLRSRGRAGDTAGNSSAGGGGGGGGGSGMCAILGPSGKLARIICAVLALDHVRYTWLIRKWV